MNIWPIIATIAIFLTAVQILPQVIKSIKTKKTKDISLIMVIIISLGAASWLSYGIHINDIPLIIANSLNLLFSTTLLILKIKFKK